jgi:hypothetical protein
MKTLRIAIGLLVLAGTMFLSCRKNDLREQQQDQEITMENLQVTPTFNWETTREVTVVLTSNASGVVRIQPTEGMNPYNKGYLEKGTTYETIIKIPTYADSVRLTLNGVSHSLKISGNALTYHFE